MKEIILTKGQKSLVDDDDYEKVNQFKWQACSVRDSKLFYAKRTKYENGKRVNVQMARFIMGLNDKKIDQNVIDHINHNTLDNRKSNLRITDIVGNNRNTSSRKTSKSKYVGVVWASYCNKWRARIVDSTTGERKEIHLGIFDDEVEAAKAYNRAAKDIFGEFANLNQV